MRYKIAILGGSGLVAGELLRLLEQHADTEVVSVVSASQAGQKLGSVHQGLTALSDMPFAGEAVAEADILFLALPHGESAAALRTLTISQGTTVIDLSADHRLRDASADFVYGLTEDRREEIRGARRRGKHIANPGCFATAIQLGLLPLLRAGLPVSDLHSSAVTGSTGAGNAQLPSTHFSWRQGNMQVYKPLTHQHLGEIRETLRRHVPGYEGRHFFIPYRGPFTRGIIACTYTAFDGDASAVADLYHGAYDLEHFVAVCEQQPALKDVVNTNNCQVHVEVREGMFVVTSVIDNLLKGAAGQAVQNMNLVLDLDEGEGLQLKASVY
ncbi:N-acetyl-gamma-glutamyl-phosphate reductase [bacterium]|nr:N-acetyl-gamma-glutamyl-phosphate reductase [bacterium]